MFGSARQRAMFDPEQSFVTWAQNSAKRALNAEAQRPL